MVLASGNAQPSTWLVVVVLVEGTSDIYDAGTSDGGGEGTEWAIGVDEEAGIGTMDSFEPNREPSELPHSA